MSGGRWAVCGRSVRRQQPGFSTSDGGATWVNETTGLSSSQRVNDITCFSDGSNHPCYAVGEFGGIAYTANLADSGSAWNLQSLPSGSLPSGLSAVSCAAGSIRCYITSVSSPGQLFSNSGGSGWTAVTTGLTINYGLTDLICTYLSGSTATRCLVAGDYGRIIGTNNSGASWTDQTGGILSEWIAGLSCPNPSTCFAAGNIKNGSVSSGLILGTTDRGHTWQNLAPPGTPFADTFSAISCVNTSPVSCVAVGNLYNSSSGGLTTGIYVTSDGGASWISQSVLRGPLNGVSCVNGAASFSCVIVGGENFSSSAGSFATVIYRSTDSGVTWHLQSPPAGFAHKLNGVSCPTATACYAAGGSYAEGKLRVIGTTDGATWTEKLNRTGLSGNEFSGINCPTTSRCYAVGGTVNSTTANRIEVTTDGGVNWQVPGIPVSPFLRAVSCVSPLSCFVAGNNGAILTTNEGSPWTAMASSTTIYLSAMSCTVVICITGGLGGGILESPLLVTNSEDTDSRTVPGTLSYALDTAYGYQSIHSYAPDHKVSLSGSNPLPSLQRGVRFVGGSCTAKLTINAGRNKAGLVLEGGNWITGLRLNNTMGPGIATAGPGNRISCVEVRI